MDETTRPEDYLGLLYETWRTHGEPVYGPPDPALVEWYAEWQRRQLDHVPEYMCFVCGARCDGATAYATSFIAEDMFGGPAICPHRAANN